jgi:putative ABC transport system permease protein
LPEHYWPAILPLRFLLVNILTWILLAIVILLAVWLPASKAAEMEPAEALRYDG